MTREYPTHLQMTLLLPLDVVAHQLMKIETELRLLNIKAMEAVRGGEHGHHAESIEPKLERINEALDSIKQLVSAIETDIQSRTIESGHHLNRTTTAARRDEPKTRAGTLPDADLLTRKAPPERDD
jgi:hypothetical protein